MKPQIEVIADLLRAYKRVTLRMMAEAGILYTGRNRISDLRKAGWMIDTYRHDKDSEMVSDNAYILVSEPVAPTFDEQNQAVMPL